MIKDYLNDYLSLKGIGNKMDPRFTEDALKEVDEISLSLKKHIMPKTELMQDIFNQKPSK